MCMTTVEREKTHKWRKQCLKPHLKNNQVQFLSLSILIAFRAVRNFLNFLRVAKKTALSPTAVLRPPLFHSRREGPNLFCHAVTEEADISRRFYRAVIDKAREKKGRGNILAFQEPTEYDIVSLAWTSRQEFSVSCSDKKKKKERKRREKRE